MWNLIIPAVAGLVGTKYAADKATSTAKQSASTVDQLERERFEQAKIQAEELRAKGDEAAAQAFEEAYKADVGAAKYEAMSNMYATRADDASARREQYAQYLYDQTAQQARARETAGRSAASDILASASGVRNAAAQNEQRMNQALQTSTGYLDAAYGDIAGRYDPFVRSEQTARGQLDVEMGLAPGDVNRNYRTSPAYAQMMDASRVAETEAKQTIDQANAGSGSLYSGTRGAALMDRGQRGSYERAAVEQGYFQNYMNMLQQMANPQSTNTLSGFQADTAANKSNMAMGTAENIGGNYMNAAGTGLNAQTIASQIGLDTMRTGLEGSEMMQYMDPGTAGAPYALSGMDRGTAGSPYRMGAQDYRYNAQAGAGGMITGNMPSGVQGSNYRMDGTAASNAALADAMGAGANIYSAYIMGQPSRTSTPTGPNTPANTNPGYGPSYKTPYQAPYSPYLR